jgi:hypothetical protein
MSDDTDACQQRPPINLKTERNNPTVRTFSSGATRDTDEGKIDPLSPKAVEAHRDYIQSFYGVSEGPNRRASVYKVCMGVEQRLASRDDERAETPYPPFVMVCFALGKLLRYYNSVLTGRKPNPTEITEALDYLVMHEMGEWGNVE